MANPPAKQRKRKSALQPRNKPVQQRSRERTQQILDVTARLLEQYGFNDLTTILIAKELGISVGSLYHYFPNKHAILYAMGEQWLAETAAALQQMHQWELETLSLEAFIDKAVERTLKVYRQQQGILPLVQAMFSVPELRELDLQHDELVISEMSVLFKRLGINKHIKERQRIARAWLELNHALLLVVVNQQGERARRTLQDLKHMAYSLLASHREPCVAEG